MKALKIGAGVIAVLVIGNLFLTHVLYRIFPGLMGIGFLSLPNPPRPEVTYGEFPFRLVYEINGEQITIEDSIVCEFDGFGVDAGRGKFRQWKSTFLSSGEEVDMEGIVLLEDAEKTIFFDVGDAIFYMRDWEKTIYEDAEIKDFDKRIAINPVDGINGLLSEKDLLEEYNIRIIEWTHAAPIENTFK